MTNILATLLPLFKTKKKFEPSKKFLNTRLQIPSFHLNFNFKATNCITHKNKLTFYNWIIYNWVRLSIETYAFIAAAAHMESTKKELIFFLLLTQWTRTHKLVIFKAWKEKKGFLPFMYCTTRWKEMSRESTKAGQKMRSNNREWGMWRVKRSRTVVH